jgi:hypothetical protein
MSGVLLLVDVVLFFFRGIYQGVVGSSILFFEGAEALPIH